MERALIIRKPWIDMILSGEKVWEMRSRPTNVCEKIGLIEQGSGLIVGECWITASLAPLKSEKEAFITMGLHKVQDLSLLKKWKYPWQLSEAKRFDNPIHYNHPKGAVTWVKLK